VAKKYIDQKIELHSGTKTEDYLEILDKALKRSFTCASLSGIRKVYRLQR